MKKLFVVLLLLCIPVGVYAKDVKREYKYYYLEKEYSDTFYEEGKNDPEYPYQSSTWHYSDEVVSSTKPEIEEDIVRIVPVLKYQEHQKVRYIIVDEITSDSKINFQEIQIFNKNTKIEYSINCSSCSSDFFALIQNTRTSYEYNYVDNGRKLTIDLKDEYFPEDLTIKFFLGGASGKKGSFRVTVNSTNDLSNPYFQYSVSSSLVFAFSSIKNLKDVEHEERLSDEVHEIKGQEEIENAKILEKTYEYVYRNRLYQYYKEIKHYVDGYYENIDGLIRDEEDFIEVEEEDSDVQTPSVEIPDPIVEYVEKEVLVPTPEYIEKTVEVPTTITEYLEKKVVVPKVEKVYYPVETVKEVKVPVDTPKEEQDSVLQLSILDKYCICFLSTFILRKMSFFVR